MNLILIVTAILIVISAVDPADAVDPSCYTCQGRPTKEKGGTCRATTAADTDTKPCTGQCQTKIEDKTSLGMGIWYKRACADTCTADSGDNDKSSFTVTCCSTNLCNGPGPATTTTAATTTTTTGTTTTTTGGTTTTTLGGTATTTTGGTTATTATTVTSPPPTTTTTTVLTSPPPTTTTTVPANADKCYECATFFLGSVCSDDTVTEDPMVEKVVCDALTTGTCAKIKTSIGFEWLDFDFSISRGCTTKCSGKEDKIEHSLFTNIHCCEGDLCNKAITNIPTRMVLLAAVAAMLFYYFV